MNFYTFSFNASRGYVIWVFALAILPAFGLFALGAFLEPLYGDLTRIGFFAERDFGWNQPQLKFSKANYTKNQYTRYHDVVVIGDSFSNAWPLQQWQNHFVASTGLSIVTLELKSTTWEDILKNQIFLDTPPKILVFESVERALIGRIKDSQPCDLSVSPTKLSFASDPLIGLKDISGNAATLMERNTAWGDVKLGFVARYLWHNALRRLTGTESTDARKVALTGVAPFSSVNKREMLVYKDDFNKVSSWNAMKLREMNCRIDKIRSLVEANGKTQFILMIAPDKLTTYAEYLTDRSLQDISLLGELAEQSPTVIPRIDLALKDAVRAGELDVYLPDDTHWGSSGHRIAARSLLDFLRIRK